MENQDNLSQAQKDYLAILQQLSSSANSRETEHLLRELGEIKLTEDERKFVHYLADEDQESDAAYQEGSPRGMG